MFPRRLVLIHLPGSMLWHVARPFEIRSNRYDRVFVVPRGFQTDLASVPQILWSKYPPCGHYVEGAVGHDYLYSLGGTEADREQADGIFLEAMEELGVSEADRVAIWSAVRLFGGSHFKNRGSHTDCNE